MFDLFTIYTSVTYVCVSGGKKCSFFCKIYRALFSCYLRFEIRLFPLLQAQCMWNKILEHAYLKK